MPRRLRLVLCTSLVLPGMLLMITSKTGETNGVVNDSESRSVLVAQDAARAQDASAITQATGIIPADRMTTWNPGLNAVGGIPNRTTIYRTLSPRGGSL